MSKIIKKTDIANTIHNKIGYTKTFGEQLVESILSIMKKKLHEGQDVKIHGFGNFVVKHKKERKGRNPQTGETMTISARKILKFYISQTLRNEFKDK